MNLKVLNKQIMKLRFLTQKNKDVQNIIGVTEGAYSNKKKGKAPKDRNAAQSKQTIDYLILDLSIIQLLKSLELEVPAKKAEISKVLDLIAEKLQTYQKVEKADITEKVSSKAKQEINEAKNNTVDIKVET